MQIQRREEGDKEDCSLLNLAYGTSGENALDQVRHGTHVMANKTHCPSRHRYDDENTRIYRGRRYCKACRRNRQVQSAFRAASVPTERAA
jgi:transposase-like protein